MPRVLTSVVVALRAMRRDSSFFSWNGRDSRSSKAREKERSGESEAGSSSRVRRPTSGWGMVQPVRAQSSARS